ncbi:hypothetical protein Sste5346_008769 [Sporothrix stenoceras]|uniref:Uncharacterized protein n=1 Tax=Sporothrix stenoceras TaxID=5173 RepID=A0ABR3YP44_9PEZI
MSAKDEKTGPLEDIVGKQITIDGKGTAKHTLNAGAEMFNEAAAYTAEDLEQEEKAVKKRLDRTLLPMEWIVFSPLVV